MNRTIILVLFVIAFIIIIFTTKFKKSEIGIIYGNDNGIEVVNYTSFQCISCANMHSELYSSIKKYIDSGDIKYIEKQIDIRRFEFDDVIYKHLNDKQIKDFNELSKIYKTQSEWVKMKSPEEVIEFLNLNKNENRNHIKNIKAIDKEKMKLELKEVPAIFVNGEKLSSNISKEEFEEKIEGIKSRNN